MNRLRRLTWQAWPVRWWRAGAALWGGVRLHPSVVLLGRPTQVSLGRGSVLGARVRLDLASTGRLVTGENVWLAAETEVESNTEVRIGDGTTVQRRCTLNGSVRLGRGCILAPNVFVSSGTHPFRVVPHLPIRAQELWLARQGASAMAAIDRPVWIQDDCWLGVNAVVCPGVTIGKGAVVGANAVVTRNVAPYTVVGGAPTRVIGRRLDWVPPGQVAMDHDEDLVFVLSGRPVHEAGRALGVNVCAVEPLWVAVAADAERVRVRYRARVDIDVLVGEVRHRLSAGDGVIELPTRLDVLADAGRVLELVVLDTDVPDVLRVFQVSRA